ncbi:MAG: TIGR02221 family CRISPR-associated protein [Fimbriimonadales bacterium]|nr:TIGR02221 family CRISPR-associated protein [Fimbriimonadales bacterium]
MQPIDKLITTLGTGRYESTRYRLHTDQEPISTPFFPVAVAQWFRPQQVYVLLTDVAQGHENWRQCKAAIEGLMPAENIHEVRIPDGKSEQELWQLFGAVTDVVSAGDRVVIDVTHGFRSLPMLTLLAIAYLRQAKGVQVERILYGAFEAKDAQGVAPTFDLTPFVSLFDWLTAAKIFMTTGDGRELAELMENAQNQAFRQGAPNPPRQLKSLARGVREVSENLLLSRAPLLAESVQKLQANLAQETLAAEVEAWLPPLAPIFSQVQQRYASFAQENLAAQLELIRWYDAHGHLVQAYTLAREWLVNYELHRQGRWESRNDKDAREGVEAQLRQAVQESQPGGLGSNPIADLWARLGDYRNDIAHCGFREHSKPAATLRQDLKQIIKQMESLLSQGETP